MGKRLIITFNLFNNNQNIYLVNNKEVLLTLSASLDLIPEELSRLFNQYEDINEIDLKGYESYLKEFGSNLLNTLITKYANNKEMRIYINGKIFN